MLIPRFSIRWVLLMMVLVAAFCLVIARGLEGKAWALSVVAVGALTAACFLAYAATFLIAYGCAQLLRVVRPTRGPSVPFATSGELPPQLIPQDPSQDVAG